MYIYIYIYICDVLICRYHIKPGNVLHFIYTACRRGVPISRFPDRPASGDNPSAEHNLGNKS